MVPSESCDINWYQRFKLQEPDTCQHFWNGLYYDSRQEKAKEFLKKFKEYLIKERIISSSLKNYDNIKNKRLQNILSFLEAHVRSYFYIFNEGNKYALMNNTQDLNMWRAKSYEKDFEIWFEETNNECKKFEVKYLSSAKNSMYEHRVFYLPG